jgi:formylglycine-generating enzyme required for sulfatase activity
MGSPDSSKDADADEHPRHEVTLSAYCIDRTEVTVAAYSACAAAGACTAPPRTVNWSAYSPEDANRYSRWCNRSDRPDHPINCIDWDQAAAYCAWKGLRLPTEAEWEYAARGNDDRVYPWGNEAPSASRLNMCGAECAAMAKRDLQQDWKVMYEGSDGWETTAPVGSYPHGATRSGVLDMAGNVWEWTADWRDSYPASAAADPRGPAAGSGRSIRGNGWHAHRAIDVRAAVRSSDDPAVSTNSTGLRCAATR